MYLACFRASRSMSAPRITDARGGGNGDVFIRIGPWCKRVRRGIAPTERLSGQTAHHCRWITFESLCGRSAPPLFPRKSPRAGIRPGQCRGAEGMLHRSSGRRKRRETRDKGQGMRDERGVEDKRGNRVRRHQSLGQRKKASLPFHPT